MGKHKKSPIARARNELFSHVIRCDVLDAEMGDREAWLEETMEYMAHRYPDLSQLQLAQLGMIGSRFIKPAIPHGQKTTAINRDKWEGEAHEQELAAAEPDAAELDAADQDAADQDAAELSAEELATAPSA